MRTLDILLVGTGGFVGSALRYVVGGLVHRAIPFARFPWGTLTVNLVGCLLLGWLAGAVEGRQALSPEARLFLMIGILGGFTTFSTFGYETFGLLQEGEHLAAGANVLLQVLVGVAAAGLGFVVGRAG